MMRRRRKRKRKRRGGRRVERKIKGKNERTETECATMISICPLHRYIRLSPCYHYHLLPPPQLYPSRAPSSYLPLPPPLVASPHAVSRAVSRVESSAVPSAAFVDGDFEYTPSLSPSARVKGVQGVHSRCSVRVFSTKVAQFPVPIGIKNTLHAPHKYSARSSVVSMSLVSGLVSCV